MNESNKMITAHDHGVEPMSESAIRAKVKAAYEKLRGPECSHRLGISAHQVWQIAAGEPVSTGTLSHALINLSKLDAPAPEPVQSTTAPGAKDPHRGGTHDLVHGFPGMSSDPVQPGRK